MTLITTPMYYQAPDARLDYLVDWEPFLTSISDTANTFAWIASTDLTLSDETTTATTHGIVINGGIEHRTYRITSRITTTTGRVQDQSFFLAITRT